MKILIVKTVPGELFIKDSTYNHQELGLAKAFIRKGYQCDIMCCCNETPSIQKIDIGNGNYVTLYCMKAIKVLKNGFYYNVDHLFSKYDMLHVSEYNQMFSWHMAKKYANKMIIYHGPYYSIFNKRYNAMSKVFDALFLKRYIKLGTYFITKSNLATDYLKDKGIKNVTTIGVGIDIEALSTSEKEKHSFVKQLSEVNSFKLLYIGRIEPRRNPYFLIDLLYEILARRENVSLVIVGTGDEKYVKSVFNYAREKSVFDKIIYKEKLEQKYMEQLYLSSDIFLLPTIYDIFGMVLLEAMYFKKCVLTTVNGGSNMLINNGKNGFVFEKFDSANWANTIEYLMDNKEAKIAVEEMVYKKITTKFTWEILSSQFLKVYDSKLQKN